MTLRLNLDNAMLEQIAEGVILLDRQANPLQANPPAQRWVQQTQRVAEALKRLIADEIKGRVALPVRIDPCYASLPAAPSASWLIKNGRSGYAIWFQQRAERRSEHVVAPPASKNPEPGLVALMGREAMTELRQVAQQMREPGAQKLPAWQDRLARAGQLLEALTDLAGLMQRDLVFQDERVEINPLIAGILPELRRFQRDHSVQYEFYPDEERSGTVYGHSAWLRYAIEVLLDGLSNTAPARSWIEVSSRQMGDFIVITGGVNSAHQASAAKGQGQLGAAPAGPVPKPVPRHDARVQLMMCRRIIELHSGQLKLELQDVPPGSTGDVVPVESFTLTLASGVPDHERSRASCADCRYTLQAQAYANDIAILMSRK